MRDPNDGVVRDLRTELLAVIGNGEWWTLNKLRKPKDDGGAGASPDKLKSELEALTNEGVLEFAVGPEGQRRDAKCWRLKRLGPVEDASDAYPESGSRGEAEGRSVLPSLPLEGETVRDASTDTERGDDEASRRRDA